MKINREDVVQSALNVQRWCEQHFNNEYICDCPFAYQDNIGWIDCIFHDKKHYPKNLYLEEFLRNRGIKDDK